MNINTIVIMNGVKSNESINHKNKDFPNKLAM